MSQICQFSINRLLYITSIMCKRDLRNVLKKVYFSSDKNARNMSTIDVLDDFTTRLINKKSSKWTDVKKDPMLVSLNSGFIKKKWKLIVDSTTLPVDVKCFTIDQLDSVIKGALDCHKYDEIRLLIDQCISYRLTISKDLLISLFCEYSNMADISTVSSLQQLCTITHADLLKSRSNFDHYLGIAHWRKGNIDTAIRLFCDVYKSNLEMKNVMSLLLKSFIYDVIKNSSEASNVVLKQYIINFVLTEKIHCPLLIFWECCVLSEWFRDQQLSETLLMEYDFIKMYLENKCILISHFALKEHNDDAVLRILQMLLKYDKRNQYISVIRILFDYRYKMEDSKGCSEIVKNCISLGIDLTQQQYNNYLHKFVLDVKVPQNTKPTIKKSKPIKLEF